MATLFNQPPRSSGYGHGDSPIQAAEALIADVESLSKRLELDRKFVLKAFEIAELNRANNLAMADGDAKDEQLSGFGELLQELIAALTSRQDSD